MEANQASAETGVAASEHKPTKAPPNDREKTKNSQGSTELPQSGSEASSSPDPLESLPSYGKFSNLAEELDVRAKSRELTKKLNTEKDLDSREGKPRKFDFKVGDKSLREYIDRDMPKELGTSIDVEPVPRGDRTVDKEGNAEDGKRSRKERLREKLTRNREDALGGVKSTTDKVQGLFDRPPTSSHSVVKTDQPIIEAQPHAADAGEVVAALVSGAIVLGGLYQKGRDRLAARQGSRDDDHR